MAQVVPLQAIPNQTVNVLLGGQICQINVYQKPYGLYLDLLVNNVLVIGGVVCENLNKIVRSLYLGFLGDLAFIDNQGSSDPDYTGLGGVSARFSLLYLSVADLAGTG